MTLRRALLALTALALLSQAVLGVVSSGATYTSASTSRLAVSASADWTPPVVAVDNPGTAVNGVATISATATDDRSGVASVTLEYAAADSGAWRVLCTTSTAPYACSWNTLTVADGSYDLRARAVDAAGYAATSSVVSTRVVNTAAVVLDDVVDPARGLVTLTGRYLNGGTTTAQISFQYVASGATNWRDVTGCGANGAPVGSTRVCTWDTSGLTGDYDVRAVAVNSLKATYYDVQPAVGIDNTAPAISLGALASPLIGTVVLRATGTDADSGMASVSFQYRRSGTTTWSTCGTDTTDPWTCSLSTPALADGSYDFRAIGTDLAGNPATTAVQSATVNNTVSSVSITSPAADEVVLGAVVLTADANSTAGVTSVAFQARPSGGPWTTACTDPSAPYSCTWDTSPILSAGYEVRAVLTDGNGVQTISAAVPVLVDNRVLRGQDVQIANVRTIGLPAAGDQVVLTYSGIVDLASIRAGWTGSATPLSLVFNDKNVAGGPLTGYDWLAFSGTNLGTLSLAQNYVRSRASVTIGATMAATTQTVNGVAVTVVTVTLGSSSSATALRSASQSGTERWYPSALVMTTSGLSSSTVPVAESGVLDNDF